MDLKEEIILGKSIHNHWYYLSKALAIKKLLKGETEKKIIDIGSGSGFFSEFFIKSMNFSEAWCVDISYEREYEKIINNKKIYFRKSIQNIESKLVLMLDVIEHIEDDAKFLESYVENSLPGTKFVISVPAFQLLWSNHDEFLEHKRRYTLFEIENLIKKSGLTIKYSSYFFGIIFPCVLAIRFLKKLKIAKAE